MKPKSNKLKKKRTEWQIQQQQAKDAEEEANARENVISTQVVRRDVLFGHSEFVQSYLRKESKAQIGEKMKMKMNMTFCKPSDEPSTFQQMNQESMKTEEATEMARIKLQNAQK